MSRHPTFPETFVVQRDEDVSGISGEGVVAEGVRFSDGWVVTHWLDQPPMHEPKTDVWHHKGVGPFRKIHGHGGSTRILWADDVAAARRKALADVVEAFAVPPEICGTEAEGAYWREQIEHALRGASTEMRVESVEDLPGVPGPVELRGWLTRFTDAVVPTLAEVLEQRNRAKRAAGRAYLLADRWEAAHGSAMFLVRAAGVELRDVLDDSGTARADFVHLQSKVQDSGLSGVDEAATAGTGVHRSDTAAATEAPCHAYEPPRSAADSGFCARCGMYDYKHHAASAAATSQKGFPDAPATADDDALRGMLTDVLTAEHNRRARERIVPSPEEHSAAMADAAMRVLAIFRRAEEITPATTCSARYTGVLPVGECIRATGHLAVTDHTDDRGRNWGDSVAEYPTFDGPLSESRAPTVDVDEQSTARIGANDRRACPYCTGAPQFLRSELGAHVEEKHARVLAVLASGISLDEQLAGPDTWCRLPHEMEA